MDITLRDFLSKADKIHRDIFSNPFNLGYNNIKSQLYELEGFVKQIQSISLRIAKIYNICKNKITINNLIYNRSLKLESINPFPGQNDWKTMNKNQTADTKLLAPNISVYAKEVPYATDIPNTELFWLKDFKQFAIQINGIILKGNIGNIFSRGEDPINILNCKELHCDKLLSNNICDPCNYYHHPEQLVLLYKKNKLTFDTLEFYLNRPKNFDKNSFLYCNKPICKKNIRLRHFGNRETLVQDLELNYLRNKESVENFKEQVFHDILILMAINQLGYLEENQAQLISPEYKPLKV